MQKPRLLFIVKRREDYNDDESYSLKGISTGLWNSARLVVEMLNDQGIEANLVEVIDNNCIDREVTQYQPTHVIIEALWVVPEKFEVLIPLHKNVKWNIRMHSEIPFVANEGIAMKWLLEYLKFPNVSISCNSKRFLKEIRYLVHHKFNWINEETIEKVWYTPNYYNVFIANSEPSIPLEDRDYINIACFGAIRPLKNQLTQAIAAIQFANRIGKKLHFHINIGRFENKGDPVFKNIKDLFDHLQEQGHELKLHPWMVHEKFLKVMKHIDIGMQVSFTETFNIVSADMVACGVPMVVSSEVHWALPVFADPNDTTDIVSKLMFAWRFRVINVKLNRWRLKAYSKAAIKAWMSLLNKFDC